MSQDWRKNYEQKLARQRAEAAREEEARRAAAKESGRREYERKMAIHESKFKCHVCGKPSAGPYEAYDENGHYDPPDWNYPTGLPAGLERCDICRKWTCNDDLYNNNNGTYTCRRCAGY